MNRFNVHKDKINKIDLGFIFFAYIITGFVYSYFIYFINRVNLTYDWNVFSIYELPILFFSGILSYFWSFLVCLVALIFFSIQEFLPKIFVRSALEISLLCFWVTVLLFKTLMTTAASTTKFSAGNVTSLIVVL